MAIAELSACMKEKEKKIMELKRELFMENAGDVMLEISEDMKEVQAPAPDITLSTTLFSIFCC